MPFNIFTLRKCIVCGQELTDGQAKCPQCGFEDNSFSPSPQQFKSWVITVIQPYKEKYVREMEKVEKGYEIIHLMSNKIYKTQNDIEKELLSCYFLNSNQMSFFYEIQDQKAMLNAAYKKRNAEIYSH